MNFTEFYTINEMIVIGKRTNSNNIVIAFDKWIWIIDQNNETKDVMNDIKSKLPKLYKRIQTDIDNNDLYRFIKYIAKSNIDILIGNINNDVLYLNPIDFRLDPKSSLLVKKVVKELGLSGVKYKDYNSDKEVVVTKNKMVGKVSDVMYHGTSSKYLESILKFGLVPNKSESNYKDVDVEHPSLIFMTSMMGTAKAHAEHVAELTKSKPVVFEFKIPDMSKLIADYDVEKEAGLDKYYSDIITTLSRRSIKDDPLKLSQEFGMYGYKGRIPANFIKYVYYGEEFEKMLPKFAIELNRG